MYVFMLSVIRGSYRVVLMQCNVYKLILIAQKNYFFHSRCEDEDKRSFNVDSNNSKE